MKTILTLTKNTFRETIRDKILLVIAFFGVILIAATQMLAAISARQEEKILVDMGLGMIDIFGMLITIFVGTQLIFREIDKKTIFVLLSKPISRASFLISKFLGLGAILTLITGIMLLVFITVVAVQTDLVLVDDVIQTAFVGKLVIIAGFSLLSFLLLLALVIFFSSFMQPVLATFSSLTMFVVGHITDDIWMFAHYNREGGGEAMKAFANAVYYGLPNFSSLNMKNFVLNDIPVSTAQMLSAAGGALAWMVLLLLLATFFFSKREF